AHPGQPPGLSDAAPVGQVGQHVQGLLVGKLGPEQWSALAFGEPVLATPAVQQTGLLLAVPAADGQVPRPTLGVLGAEGVEAAKAGEVLGSRFWGGLGEFGSRHKLLYANTLTPFNSPGAPPDIFGNPFRPVARNPSWLTSDVHTLARQMYDGRDFTP